MSALILVVRNEERLGKWLRNRLTFKKFESEVTAVEFMTPFATCWNGNKDVIEPYHHKIQRRLQDIQGIFADQKKVKEILQSENPLIYEVYGLDLPEKEGHLIYCLSVVYPGKIGKEYFMTKGHFHARRDTAEIYMGLKGEGYLIMQTFDGEFYPLKVTPGAIAYVPPFWGHRSVNTSREKFIQLAIYPGNAGHDYKIVEDYGFCKILVEENGKPVFINNPEYRKEIGS